MSEPELPLLAKRARDGDRKAFEMIVRLTGRMVYAQIVAAVRDRQKAEDLTQETFVAAWRSMGSLKDCEGFVSWLLTVARNQTLDGLRFEGRQKRKGASVAGEAIEAADRARSPEQSVERREACERAVLMLEELPEEYRRVLKLRYLGGVDYETMRRQLGLSDGALRGLLGRGMAMLRERMTQVRTTTT